MSEQSGEPISALAELLIELGLERGERLILSRGDVWGPVLVQDGNLILLVGDVSPADEVTLRMSAKDARRFREFFRIADGDK